MARFRRAFSLSKEEVKEADPPGTVILVGHHEHMEEHVHLQPEPSQDPADPLKFVSWRKLTILGLMSAYAFISTMSSAILASALPDLVTAFATFSPFGPPTGIVEFSKLTQLIAVSNLMLGAANVWWVPLSNIYGRRPIVLLSLAMLAGFSFWCGAAKSFNSLLAARFFQGIGGATADTLAPDIVGRTFFVHQRGRAMAIYTIFLASGSLVGGLVGGYISSSLSWRWTMHIPGILSAGLLVLTFLFMPETLFDRGQALSLTRRLSSQSVASDTEKQASHVERATTNSGTASPTYQPYTYRRSLGFMRPREGLLRQFVRPYYTLRLPGTLMVMLHYAGLIGLVVTIATVGPTILSAPPYLWGANVGLINIGGLVGTVLGAAYTYATTDWLSKRIAKKEAKGRAEPEDRLVLMWPALLISTGGSLVFGFSAQPNVTSGWIGMEFGLGMVAFGLMQLPSVGFNYIIESYGEWASDCFLMVVALRAIISFAWIFFVGDWIAAAGPAEPFGIFALLMGIFGLTLLPIWLYGKRLRIATETWVGKEAVGNL